MPFFRSIFFFFFFLSRALFFQYPSGSWTKSFVPDYHAKPPPLGGLVQSFQMLNIAVFFYSMPPGGIFYLLYFPPSPSSGSESMPCDLLKVSCLALPSLNAKTSSIESAPARIVRFFRDLELSQPSLPFSPDNLFFFPAGFHS